MAAIPGDVDLTGCSLERSEDLEHPAGKLRNGKETAFREFVERYQARIYHVALAILGTPEQADEIARNAFVDAHRAFNGITSDSSLFIQTHWITVDECYRFLAESWFVPLRSHRGAERRDLLTRIACPQEFADSVIRNSPATAHDLHHERTQRFQSRIRDGASVSDGRQYRYRHPDLSGHCTVRSHTVSAIVLIARGKHHDLLFDWAQTRFVEQLGQIHVSSERDRGFSEHTQKVGHETKGPFRGSKMFHCCRRGGLRCVDGEFHKVDFPPRRHVFFRIYPFEGRADKVTALHFFRFLLRVTVTPQVSFAK